MNIYSEISEERLSSCSPNIQKVFRVVLKHMDHTILCGYRGKEKQQEAFFTGKSKVNYPDSKHNKNPSRGIDVAPYPIDWNDAGRFYIFAGRVLQVAEQMGIKLRFGGDWDSDTRTTDQNFNDLCHFEEVD